MVTHTHTLTPKVPWSWQTVGSALLSNTSRTHSLPPKNFTNHHNSSYTYIFLICTGIKLLHCPLLHCCSHTKTPLLFNNDPASPKTHKCNAQLTMQTYPIYTCTCGPQCITDANINTQITNKMQRWMELCAHAHIDSLCAFILLLPTILKCFRKFLKV